MLNGVSFVCCLALLAAVTGCGEIVTAVKVYTMIEEHKEHKEDRREANRPKHLQQRDFDELAQRLAATISRELPIEESIARYIEKNDARMVLVRGEVNNRAEYTDLDVVEGLMSTVLVNLQNDDEFTKYFDIVESRAKSIRLLEQSEGRDSGVIDEEGSEPLRFGPPAICTLELEFFDFDKRGETTWKAHIKVWRPYTRRSVLNRELRAPLPATQPAAEHS